MRANAQYGPPTVAALWIRRRLWACIIASGLALVACPQALAALPILESDMDRDPLLPEQTIEYHLPANWRNLWLSALSGPEEDLRRQVAEAILFAHQCGCPDLGSLAEDLQSALVSTENPTVKLTIAGALVQLDVRDAADALVKLTEAGGDREAAVIEPALARWNNSALQDVWLQRLAEPESVSRTRLRLAVEAAAATADARAEPHLLKLAFDRRQSTDVRLASAETAGKLHTRSLAEDALRLSAESTPVNLVDRLVAVRLIGTDDDAAAQQALIHLAVDPESAVAAVALDKLLTIDPALVLPLTAELLQRPQAELRIRAADALRQRPDADAVARLAALLGDPHTDVRNVAREALQQLAANPERQQGVIGHTLTALHSDDWRQLEQAARIVGELDYEPAAARLVQLLDHERSEAFVTAAWSLKRLAVADALPGMLAFAEKVTAQVPEVPGDSATFHLSPEFDQCLMHMFEAFGELRCAPAAPILRKFVPRRYDLGPRSRGAAAWALGWLNDAEPDLDIARMLAERVADAGDIPVREPVEVRASAAISLGRMKVPQTLEVLQVFYNRGGPGDRIREACGWAIEQIKGEDLPDPGIRYVVPPLDFLQPLNP